MTALAIRGWSAVSPIGLGADAFTAAIAAGLDHPPAPTFDFRPQDHVGKKGLRSLDRVTKMSIVGSLLAMQDAAITLSEEDRQEIGLVLGTSTGSLKSSSDYSRDTYVEDRPTLVNPLDLPASILNGAAGQSALWHGLTGVNTTLAQGKLSALAALKYARIAIECGHATTLLVGAVEEYTEHSAWLAKCLGNERFAEGAAFFAVESATRPSSRVAEVLAVEISSDESLGECVSRALKTAQVTSADLWCLVSDGVGEDDVYDAIGARTDRHVRPDVFLGDTYSASGAMCVAAVLAMHESDSSLDGRSALITLVDHDGAAGVAVVKGWQRANSDHRL